MPNIIILDEATISYLPHRVSVNADLVVLSPYKGTPEGYRVLKTKHKVDERLTGTGLAAALCDILVPSRDPDPAKQAEPGDTEQGWPAGTIINHSSDPEGGSPDVGISISLGDGASLWFGEIPDERWHSAGGKRMELGKNTGWWIVHYPAQGAARLIGKMADRNWPDQIDDIEALASAIRAAVAGAGAGKEPEAAKESTPPVRAVDDPAKAHLMAAIIQARVGSMTAALATMQGKNDEYAMLGRRPLYGPESFASLSTRHKIDFESVRALLDGKIEP